MSLEDLVDDYININKLYTIEGESGLQNLEKLISAIGYESNQFRYGDLIHVFLADNPGAIESIIEFIRNSNCSQWEDILKSHNEIHMGDDF